jgi:hypothetical protein
MYAIKNKKKWVSERADDDDGKESLFLVSACVYTLNIFSFNFHVYDATVDHYSQCVIFYDVISAQFSLRKFKFLVSHVFNFMKRLVYKKKIAESDVWTIWTQMWKSSSFNFIDRFSIINCTDG